MIEDVAQAFGAQAKGAAGAWRSLGLAGDIGVYSFLVGTGLTPYEGGLLLARDARVRDALDDAERSLRRHAPLLELRRCSRAAGPCRAVSAGCARKQWRGCWPRCTRALD